MKTIEKPEVKRRRQRATQRAVTGTRGNMEVGTAARRQGDNETRGPGELGLQTLRAAVTVVLSSPSLLDGFGGARDGRLLDWYANYFTASEEVKAGFVHVQCTEETKSLLHRAGIKRTRMMDSYKVAVIRDRIQRLQLAPISMKGGQE